MLRIAKRVGAAAALAGQTVDVEGLKFQTAVFEQRMRTDAANQEAVFEQHRLRAWEDYQAARNQAANQAAAERVESLYILSWLGWTVWTFVLYKIGSHFYKAPDAPGNKPLIGAESGEKQSNAKNVAWAWWILMNVLYLIAAGCSSKAGCAEWGVLVWSFGLFFNCCFWVSCCLVYSTFMPRWFAWTLQSILQFPVALIAILLYTH